MAIVEEELGAPIAGIFDQFDYEPIAAASLGNQSFIFFVFVIEIVQSKQETWLNVPMFYV